MRIGRPALAASTLLLLITAGVSTGGPLPTADRLPALSSDSAAHPRGAAPKPPAQRASHEVPFGAFVGSWDTYIPQIAQLATWLNGANLQVGHTYLAGNSWNDVEGDTKVLALWSQWRQADPSRILVLNVPMLAPNEPPVQDGGQVSTMLKQGARGAYDQHFLKLARKLVALGGGDTVLVPGWEMNGTTYTGRCEPDPAAWKAYWRRIVGVMRSVPGQRFRFDFDPNRGLDAIAWTKCYPGDDVVDIIGMDTYDQQPGNTFDDYVREPYGLEDQVEFAAKRGKPVSYPEWGLWRHGDNPEFVRRMVEWTRTHDTAYQTVTDYCPHGVWECRSNPRSSAVYRSLLAGSNGAGEPPCPGHGTDGRPVRPVRPNPRCTAATPAAPSPSPSAAPSAVPSTVPAVPLPGWPSVWPPAWPSVWPTGWPVSAARN
ncbi:hypothetical protein P3T37_003761 [Kitasatospora sp. MAA4]|uniref:glycoside hydrolase family 26 protein n=1 Tax=Kitasatospora sp. MAA4 TaxID=3035093 RepID=UPI002476D559|nr:glycosyl hydrolase [Kitasatospora sp. MAA4]MDH6134358.1 hypothetical protein [Kitasatospora sp. MAA4]